MKKNTIIDNELKYIDDEVFSCISNYTISKLDLYLTIAGTIGDVGEVPERYDMMSLTENAAKLTGIICDRKYLMYSLLSSHAQEHFSSKFHQVAQPKLSIETASSTFVPLPPFAEQQLIVAEIEKWFAVIDTLEVNQNNLEAVIKQTKSKILDLAIHGKLVPQAPNDEPAIELLKRINPNFTPCDNAHYGNIPQHWYWGKIDDICSIIGGVSYEKCDVQSFGIKILRGGNVQDGRVVECDDDVFVSSNYANDDNQVQCGDIIVVASTGSKTLIGKTGYVDVQLENTQIGAFLRIIRCNDTLLSNYLRYVFMTEDYKTYIRKTAKGSNINNIKNSHLQNFQFPIPPYAEQLRIVAKIEELFAVLDKIQESIEA